MKFLEAIRTFDVTCSFTTIRGKTPQWLRRCLKELDNRNPVSRGLLLPDGEAGPLQRVKRLLGFVPSWIEAFSARARKMHVLFSESFLARFGDREGFQPFFSDVDVRGQLVGRDPLHQSLYMWAKTGLPGYILTMLGDRMEMAHSMEGRVPFLDHHVVEVIRYQPVPQKVRGMTEKYVLREAARDVDYRYSVSQAEAPILESASHFESRPTP